MKKSIFLVLAFFCSIGFASANISGKITDKANGKVLSGVNIQVIETQVGVSTAPDGTYELELKAGKYTLEFSFMGYKTILRTVNLKEGKNLIVNIEMVATNINLNEIVVTASKTPEHISEIPGRVEVLSIKDIENKPVNSADELLTQMAGVNVDRTSGIFDHSTVVGIRGIVGGEQGRILVLQNGVPVNKSDGGSVNWNRFNVNNIQKIEVFKGPGSSIYGSNAMGGVINFITKKSLKAGIHGFADFSYATYDTKSASAAINGRLNDGAEGFYYDLSTNYRQSNGFIDVPEEERDEYTTKKNMEEYGLNARIGYDFNEKNNLEVEYNFFDDKRGQGETILNEQVREHDTHFVKGSWKAEQNNLSWTLSAFYQQEHYKGVREKGDPEDYTHWIIDSKRKDMGFFANAVVELGKHRIIFGADAKKGKVEGADKYKTSADIVWNLGSMNDFALYIQDKFSVSENLKLTAGLRLDLVKFYDGEFRIDNMTGETDFMEDYTGNLSDHNWDAFTPKAAFHYTFTKNTSLYIAYSMGFRAPTLDDLCRSGLISGGYKIANPDLGPEKVHNFEGGMNLTFNKLKIMPSMYYMLGEDFMYYLATGETIFGGRKKVLQKQNITKVQIFGYDIDAKYQIKDGLSCYVNYTFTETEVKEFEENPELERKGLTYTPKHMFNAGFNYENKIVNLAFNMHYQDKRFSDDTNEETLADYATMDVKIWKDVTLANETKLRFYFDANNLFNRTYMISDDQISLGRFISGGVSLFF